MRFLIPLFLIAIGSTRADQFGWFSQMLSAQQPRPGSNFFSGPNSFDPSVGLISPSFLSEPSAVLPPQFKQQLQQAQKQQMPAGFSNMQQMPGQQQQLPAGFSNMQQMPGQQQQLPAGFSNMQQMPGQQQQLPAGFSNMQQMPGQQQQLPAGFSNMQPQMQGQQQQLPAGFAKMQQTPIRESSVAFQNPCTENVLRLTEVKQFKNPWDRQGFLVCVDVNVFREMKCSVGTYFNEDLNHCVPEGYEPSKCPDGHCLNDGVCIVDEKNLLRCSCKKGFSGERCAVNIDECALEGNAACSGGRCIDQVNGFYCQCPSGVIGLNCQQTIRNPCTSDNIQSGLNFFEMPSVEHNTYVQCTGPMQVEVRKCPDNLHWHQEEQTCTLERAPLKAGICLTFPCKNGGECLESGNAAAGFTCACKPGYTGVMCEQMIDYCLSNPCQNDGKCLPYAGGYTCICKNKVIDECCCNGISNPCPPKSKIVPGVNNYFEHAFKQRYIHCDFDGRAFVRMCAPGTVWNQAVLTCTPERVLNAMNNSSGYGSSGYGSSSYGNSGYQQPAAIQQPSSSSYGGYQAAAPAPISTPVQQSVSNSYGGYAAAAPEPISTPVQQPAVQAPSNSYGGYAAAAPEPISTPVQQQQSYQQSYQQPAPAPVPVPVPTPAPAPVVPDVQGYGGYQASIPSPNQPVQPSYSQVNTPSVDAPISQSSNSYSSNSYQQQQQQPELQSPNFVNQMSSFPSASSSSSSSDNFMNPTIQSVSMPSNTFSSFQSSANTMPPSNGFPSSFQSSANTMPPSNSFGQQQQQNFNNLNSFVQPPTGFFKSAQKPASENTVNLMRRKILKQNQF